MTDNDRRGEVPRLFALAMLAEAATLGIASYLHRDGHIPLGFTVVRGEQFTGASVPEAVIGAILAAGAAIVLTVPDRARRAALFATGFGVFGVLAGVGFVLTSGRPSIAIDLTYHATLLAALITTLVLLALRRPRAASERAPERQRVRSR
jgi:heme A synthase